MRNLAQQANKKILLVEDNLVNCEVAVDMLEEMGVNVDIANNGQQALDLYDDNQYSLILMDCEMPVMDGFSTTIELRIKENALQKKPTPIIALTAQVASEARDKCITSGMDDFLSKPFSMLELHSMLNKWLEVDAISAEIDHLHHGNNTVFDAILENSESDSAVLNYEVLQKLYAKQKKHSHDLVDRLVGIYLEQSSKLLSDLAEACHKSDVDSVRIISHTLKSSSVNVGALSLSELCRTVEQTCEQGEISDVLVQQIHQSYSEVEKALNNFLENIDI